LAIIVPFGAKTKSLGSVIAISFLFKIYFRKNLRRKFLTFLFDDPI
jgi:hypothetical protein